MNSRGFTVTEVLLAFFIVVIAVPPVFTCISQGLSAMQRSKAVSGITAALERRMLEYQTGFQWSVPPGGPQILEKKVSSPPDVLFSFNPAVLEIKAGEKRLFALDVYLDPSHEI